MMVDNGSCGNLVSVALVKALNLKIEKYSSCYQVLQIKRGQKIQIMEVCSIELSIGK